LRCFPLAQNMMVKKSTNTDIPTADFAHLRATGCLQR
jgi:hypothetical protein